MNDVVQLPKLMKEREAAKALGVSLETLRRIRKRGEIRFRLIGGRIHYTEQDLLDYIDDRSINPCQKNHETTPSKSGNFGSANDPTATHGAEPGTTRKGAKHVEPPLAQTISKPQK